MSGNQEQFDSENNLFEDNANQGDLGQQGSNIPREEIMGQQSSFGGRAPGRNTFLPRTTPGQMVPQEQLASEQGYANTSGRSRMKSPKNSLDLGAMGSSFDPNIDYLNNKVKGANPEMLHKLITRLSSELDMSTFIENISYQGFNRHSFIATALKVLTVSQFVRFAVIGAIRGSNFKKIVENSLSFDNDLKMLIDKGVIVKTPKKTADISALRCTASIPQWAAYFMMGANVPPKIVDSTLPPFLQFPSAASLPMSTDLRRLHIEFSIKFSMLIGGAFNPNIYMAAFNNQLPMNEIPDALRLKLGVNSHGESIAVEAQGMINEISATLLRR